MSKQDIGKLVQQLCELGEDKDELNLWATIYDDLEPEEQQELTANLQNELKKLDRIRVINRK